MPPSMFRTIALLTPLRARFDSVRTPRTPTLTITPDEEELAPEDFARDVLIELMRNSVEKLKTAEGSRAKNEVLGEIHRIMCQEAKTKDVFRELDGFLALMSVLSGLVVPTTGDEDDATLHGSDGKSTTETGSAISEEPVLVEPEEQVSAELMEGLRLCFVIMMEATRSHMDNTTFLREGVGYEALLQALRSLISNRKTADATASLLLSLALDDLDLASTYQDLRGLQEDDVEAKIQVLEPKLGTIKRAGAALSLWKISPQLVEEDAVMRYAIIKLFEALFQISHRNQAILSNPLLVQHLFSRLVEPEQSAFMTAKERQSVQRFLRKVLDMGATTAEVRQILHRTIKENDTLDADVLEIVRHGMKSRWTEHISLESPSILTTTVEGGRGLPGSGYTFMMWLWVSELPTASHALFKVETPSRPLFSLGVNQEGRLLMYNEGYPEPVKFPRAKIHKFRWTHISVIHYPNKSSEPTIRVFIDGVLTESMPRNFPKVESASTLTYTIGDNGEMARMSWNIASAYFLNTPLGDDHPRFIHHLGPRYSGSFQDLGLVRFLTYEAATSLNMFLWTVTSKARTGMDHPTSSLVKALKDGMGVLDSSVVFAFSPSMSSKSGELKTLPVQGSAIRQFEVQGDVYMVRAACFDLALWKIGGAAVTLRLVQVANTHHELSRALGVLADGLKNSWQNSEDMERLRGYEILADILRTKSHLINMTSFETIFEFLGLNFRLPDQSTIVNLVAYRAIALDFELWSKTRNEIQRVYLEHFSTLLAISRYKRFNIKQRFAKLDLVRRMLFVLQTDWYSAEVIPHLVDALKEVLLANFSKTDAIKPVVSYLAANLHGTNETSNENESPHSATSHFEIKDRRDKAEDVLAIFVPLLLEEAYHARFATVLPLTRVCLLLLGDRPSSAVSTQILTLIASSIHISPSFARKFELVSGWSFLKIVLRYCWDANVTVAAFDVLLGRKPQPDGSKENQGSTVVSCPNIVPAIFAALQHGLSTIVRNFNTTLSSTFDLSHVTPDTAMQDLIEQLMNLHSTSSSFREVFKSQQSTQIFIDAYKKYVDDITELNTELDQRLTGLLEKLSHFGLALALDNCVAGSQKREILDTLQRADLMINPSQEQIVIDPALVVDSRSIRQRMASARFSIQVGERAVMKTVLRMAEWRKTIVVSERKRLRKNILDLRETRRQVSRLYDWTHLLSSERGLWPHQQTRMWRLDETEGPHRIRKKLEPENDKVTTSRVEATGSAIRDVAAPDADEESIFQADVPPWAETYEISATDMEDRQLAEEIVDDKHRRVRHELEPGDVIDAVTTVARISGVDSSPGLLIIGRTHLYMLDGLVENDDGEVVDAHDAPKRLFFVPGSIVELDGPQRAQRWSHELIASFSDKTFLFRDVALEIYFRDSRSLLIVFLDKKRRLNVNHQLAAIVGRVTSELNLTPGLLKTPIFGRSAARAPSGFKVPDLLTAQRKWEAREISNFTYISILNQVSGRTPSDATQYPVFPWVLQDYTSETLDLTNPATYRDLTKPMGALTEPRREAASTRYDNLQSVDEEPFHYGTHFSSSMIVCHFLIRLTPFNHMFKTLQGGDWDLPDRLFSDLPRAYQSAAIDVRGDVRELIPEFFTCPEFLENSSNLDFGIQQNTGQRIHDVKLPPWAHDDPLLFITMNRRALESSYVSDNLPAWIDLIWGCKQRDPESLNVFHPLSYEGSIDLDSITNELEREATVGIIHNFGQTPRKLFTSRHPPRLNHGLATLPVGTLHGIEEDPHQLTQEKRSVRDLGSPVRQLVLDTIGERIIPFSNGALGVPSRPHEQIEWSTGGAELKVVVDHKVMQTVENAYCNCACFADATSLVTGSIDYTVRLWKVIRGGSHPGISNPNMHLSLSHIMRVHTDEVVCVTASRTWSVVVSGSRDGSAAIWDLNRGVYVRSLWHERVMPVGSEEHVGRSDEGVYLVAINESTGYIATCSRTRLHLHTINGRPMATLDLTLLPTYSPFSTLPMITALAFHEREYSHLGILATGENDGTITLRTWTADGTPAGEKAQWEFLTVRAMKVRAHGGGGGGAAVVGGRPSAVTALKFIGESLCHGEESGKVFLWTLPD